MDKITDVAIDLDGVIYPFADAFRKYCITVLGLSSSKLPSPTTWEFYKEWGMDKIEFEEHLRVGSRDHNLFNSMPAEYNADYAWNKFREMGVTIHVMTYRPVEAHEQTRQWLDTHGLTPDHLWFPISKGDTIRSHGGNFMAIDDHIDNYLDMKNAGALSVLHTQPWNTHHLDALRVSNMRNFATLLDIYNTDTEVYL